MDEDEYEIAGGSNEYRRYDDKTHIRWGNLLTSVRWNHVFNGRLFSNATVAFTDYRMRMGYTTSEKSQDAGSSTSPSSTTAPASGTSPPRSTSTTPLLRGTSSSSVVNMSTMPTFRRPTRPLRRKTTKEKMVTDTTYTNKKEKNRLGHEMSFYIEDDFTVGGWLTLNPGVHLAMFLTSGRTYWSPEPRMSAKVDFGKGVSVKAAYSRMAQYVHLYSPRLRSLCRSTSGCLSPGTSSL